MLQIPKPRWSRELRETVGRQLSGNRCVFRK
jgi:hypothetical protein